MVAQVFTVLTEMRFEAAGFIANAAASSAAIQGISNAVDDAQKRISALSIGMISDLTGVSGGLIGFIGNALMGFEQLQKSQIDLAVGLQASGLDFQQRMEVSAGVLKDIKKTAMEWGLDPQSMIGTTKMLAPMLLNKGLAGPGLSNVTDLSRQYLKASPTLGIDPFEAQGQLIRAIEGQASMGDTLFMRLTSETKAMKEFVGQTKKWNALAPAEKIKKLTAALGQFANQTQANEMRLKSLTGQMNVLKIQLTGMFSIFTDLGGAVNKALVEALTIVNQYIKEELTPSFQYLSKSLSQLAPNLKEAAINADSLSKMEKKLSMTGKVLGFTGMLVGLQEVLLYLGINIPVVSAALARLASVIAFLSKPIGGTMAAGGFARLFMMARGIMGFMTVVGMAFEILFRSLGYAKIEMMKAFALQAKSFSEMISKVLNIFSYFSEGMNVIAEFLSPIFVNILPPITNALIAIANTFANVTIVFISGFTAVIAMIMQFIENIKNMFSGGSLNPFKGLLDIKDAAADMTIERLMPDLDKDGVSKPEINVNQTITMKNDFKEMLEPDRVAFTISEQLLKAARNGTGSRGNGFAKATQ